MTNELLYGIDAIRPHVGMASEATIIKWKRKYPSFPIRKLGGVWVASREALVEWFKKFSIQELKEDLAAKPKPKKAARW